MRRGRGVARTVLEDLVQDLSEINDILSLLFTPPRNEGLKRPGR